VGYAKSLIGIMHSLWLKDSARSKQNMNHKDIISKHLLKRMTLGMARVLLDLDIIELDIIETEQQRVEERRADLVAKVKAQDDDYILHIEVQNDNQTLMPWRMLRYLTDIRLAYPGLQVKQFLIYIGREKLNMDAGIEETDHQYRYQVLDMHGIDCETLLRQESPEALIFAILGDFGAYSAREVVKVILQRLQSLTGDNLAAFRDYLLMLEVLSGNRDLKQILQEEEKMLSQVKYSDLPSYGLGMQDGLEKGLEQGLEKGIEQGIHQGIERGIKQGVEQGILQGEALMLQNQLRLKFGIIPDSILQRLHAAGSEELLLWSGRILSANSLAEMFAEH
jgi:hypothetical protein